MVVARGARRPFVGALLLVVALAMPIVLVASDGTQAAKKTFKVRKGNAKPGWDIVGLQVDNAKKKLRVKVQFKAKPAKPAQGQVISTVVGLNFGKPRPQGLPHYYFTFDRSTARNPKRFYDYLKGRFVTCPGLRAVVKGKAIVFVIPRKKCLRGAAGRVRVRAKAFSSPRAKREQDRVNWRKWVKHG